jgi:hypothetical protein
VADPVTIAVIASLVSQGTWFTLTKVIVRVAQRLGGYEVEVEGPDILDEVQAMQEEGTVDGIVSVHGIAHPPGEDDQVFAFRVDESGPQVAANAPVDALAKVGPRLRGIMTSE